MLLYKSVKGDATMEDFVIKETVSHKFSYSNLLISGKYLHLIVKLFVVLFYCILVYSFRTNNKN